MTENRRSSNAISVKHTFAYGSPNKHGWNFQGYATPYGPPLEMPSACLDISVAMILDIAEGLRVDPTVFLSFNDDEKNMWWEDLSSMECQQKDEEAMPLNESEQEQKDEE